MNYISLDDYKKAWVFRHKDLPVSDEDAAKIKPMSDERAAVLALPPEAILTFLDWEANTTVYFCMARDNIIETTFDVFKRNWQNFMFLADGSLLIGKKRNTVVQFLESGKAKLGEKPSA